MDKSVINGMELNGRDANIQRSCCISRILVSGYDTLRIEFDVDTDLRKIFASCGEIAHVSILRKDIYSGLCRFAFVYIRGEGAEEKALKLSGSDVGGWNVVVKAYPFHETSLDTELAPMRASGGFKQIRMVVTGFDTKLPEDHVERMLTGLVPSCTRVGVCQEESGKLCSKALLFFAGEDVAEKALERSGTDVGGWIFEVIKIMPPRRLETGYSRPIRHLSKDKDKTTETMPPREHKIGYSRPRPLPNEANMTRKKSKTRE